MSAGEITVTAMTHRGAVRPANEDALVLGSTTVSVTTSTPVRVYLPLTAPLIIAVADGIGGQAAGEIASEHAASRLAEMAPQVTDATMLGQLLVNIDEELSDHAEQTEEFHGMGTTVAGVVVSPAGGVWFNVGDSRVYRMDGTSLVQVTEDDSPPLPPSQDGRPATTNFITQSLGGGSGKAVTPHIGPESGSAWLMCSDGLSDLVTVGEMEKILKVHGDDEAAVYALWQAAMAAGGKDNISIILARL